MPDKTKEEVNAGTDIEPNGKPMRNCTAAEMKRFGDFLLKRAQLNSEPDDVGEAINHVLHEVEAALRELKLTGFYVQQVEALRRIDRAKASFGHLVRLRNCENKKDAV
jgi:hypothetical protein